MNPLDIRTVVLAKHAQHVVLIHFPIALFIAAVAFDYLAVWTKNRTLAAAFFNLLLAAISTVPVVGSGFAAWQWALEGRKLKGILFMHLVLGCISSVLIRLVCWIHWHVRASPSARHTYDPRQEDVTNRQVAYFFLNVNVVPLLSPSGSWLLTAR